MFPLPLAAGVEAFLKALQSEADRKQAQAEKKEGEEEPKGAAETEKEPEAGEGEKMDES